ncbi:MAG: hypothetical protein P8I51_02325 [Polaribacter sp.]|jgi:hypothetical protein|nr:hypothetical protein [Polaribacter sp.]MDG1953713.1 hypothetical protein [Polaribacter sp.]
MNKNFETKFTAWAFIIAAILLWGGWFLSPHNVGEYFVASDFESIGESVWYWIWMFRFHIFGWVTMGIALFALWTLLFNSPHRIVMMPGIGMLVVGTFTIAIAAAFYYNYGAWGVGKTAGKSATEIKEFMDGILFTNQYVTCFVRFGRIFSGVGLVLLGVGFLKGNIVNKALAWFTILLGAAAMGIILGIPEYYETYKPLFHVKVVWLLLMGFVILKNGIRVSAKTE